MFYLLRKNIQSLFCCWSPIMLESFHYISQQSSPSAAESRNTINFTCTTGSWTGHYEESFAGQRREIKYMETCSCWLGFAETAAVSMTKRRNRLSAALRPYPVVVGNYSIRNAPKSISWEGWVKGSPHLLLLRSPSPRTSLRWCAALGTDPEWKEFLSRSLFTHRCNNWRNLSTGLVSDLLSKKQQTKRAVSYRVSGHKAPSGVTP